MRVSRMTYVLMRIYYLRPYLNIRMEWNSLKTEKRSDLKTRQVAMMMMMMRTCNVNNVTWKQTQTNEINNLTSLNFRFTENFPVYAVQCGIVYHFSCFLKLLWLPCCHYVIIAVLFLIIIIISNANRMYDCFTSLL